MLFVNRAQNKCCVTMINFKVEISSASKIFDSRPSLFGSFIFLFIYLCSLNLRKMASFIISIMLIFIGHLDTTPHTQCHTHTHKCNIENFKVNVMFITKTYVSVVV